MQLIQNVMLAEGRKLYNRSRNNNRTLQNYTDMRVERVQLSS
jgi:hypothetical protein